MGKKLMEQDETDDPASVEINQGYSFIVDQ